MDMSSVSQIHVYLVKNYEHYFIILVDYLEELPETDEPAWILGRQHHLKTGKFSKKPHIASLASSRKSRNP